MTCGIIDFLIIDLQDRDVDAVIGFARLVECYLDGGELRRVKAMLDVEQDFWTSGRP